MCAPHWITSVSEFVGVESLVGEAVRTGFLIYQLPRLVPITQPAG